MAFAQITTATPQLQKDLDKYLAPAVNDKPRSSISWFIAEMATQWGSRVEKALQEGKAFETAVLEVKKEVDSELLLSGYQISAAHAILAKFWKYHSALKRMKLYPM